MLTIFNCKFFEMNSCKNTDKHMAETNQSQGMGQFENGSTSMIGINLFSEFNEMQELVLNLFVLAKQELNDIYQGVVKEVARLSKLIAKETPPRLEYLELIVSVKKQAKAAIGQLPQRLRSLVVSSEDFYFQREERTLMESIEFSLQPEKKITATHNKIKSIRSITSQETPEELITSQDYKNKNHIKRINLRSKKCLKNLKFLEGQWPSLEEVRLNNKKLLELSDLIEVHAHKLKVLDLADNHVRSLQSFRGAYFPHMIELNLGGNRIQKINGLEEANLPNLRILNLSQNLIYSVDGLEQCSFPQLLQLDISSNKITSLESLHLCDFQKLQIFNLDENKLLSLKYLSNCRFFSLKLLSFAHNEITSLQFLQASNLKRLQGLIGHHNFIKSLDPLAHCSMPALREIVLHSNQIESLDCIPETNFPSLIGFDLEQNKIKRKEAGCLFTYDKTFNKALKKYPFILL